MFKLETGYVCDNCGEPVSAMEVLNKNSECCGFPCVLGEDFIPQYTLFNYKLLADAD